MRLNASAFRSERGKSDGRIISFTKDMSKWFYDGPQDGGECQLLRRQAQALEKEYLEIRVLLREAEAALRASPQDVQLQENVESLRKKQADLESQARFADDYPPEFALGAPPHG
jgi:hypothetical protein